MHVSMGLKQLKSINLSFCLSISDSGLKYLAKMPSLCELNLRSCDNISDVGMAYLAEGGSRITSLDVSFCDRIDDSAVVHVAQGLVHLKQLSLSACHVSDEGLIRVALSLLDLQTLNIGQCSRITDRSIQAVADHLRKLRCIGKTTNLWYLIQIVSYNAFLRPIPRSLRVYKNHHFRAGENHETSSAQRSQSRIVAHPMIWYPKSRIKWLSGKKKQNNFCDTKKKKTDWQLCNLTIPTYTERMRSTFIDGNVYNVAISCVFC